MNLENYKVYQMVACTNKETGKFTFVCQATPEGVRACREQANQANHAYKKEQYTITFFSAWMKKRIIETIG